MTAFSHARRGLLALALISLAAPPAVARKKREELPPATTGLIDNVNGIAPDANGRLARFNGLLIGKDGRVEKRLSRDDERPERLAYRYDAKGKVLIPSFIAGHDHVIARGIGLMTLDLSDTGSLAEAQAKIAAYARANPDRKWILGSGWDAARLGATGNALTAADLDTAVPDRPVWLVSADGRTGWANTLTLKLAGKSGGGVYGGADKREIEGVVPTPAPKDRDIAFDKVQRFYIEHGISAVADMGTDMLDWQSYRRAGDRGALRVRVVGYAGGIDDMVTIAGPAPSPWLYDDRLRLVGVHFPVDTDNETVNTTRLHNQMSRAAMDGFQVALSTWTGADKDMARAAITEMQGSYSGDRRWRIEDGATASIEPFARLAELTGRLGDVAPALVQLTSAAAHDLQAEGRLGALEPGQWADFLLVDRDISIAAPADLGATQILEHWIGGKRAWTKGETVSVER